MPGDNGDGTECVIKPPKHVLITHLAMPVSLVQASAVRPAQALSSNHPRGSCGLWFRWNKLQAELLSPLQHGSNLLFTMTGLIVDGPSVHVLLSFRQESTKI
jgi:hypothetical protein